LVRLTTFMILILEHVGGKRQRQNIERKILEEDHRKQVSNIKYLKSKLDHIGNRNVRCLGSNIALINCLNKYPAVLKFNRRVQIK